MKILLTGHRGFIGQHMLRELTNRGHAVTTYEWRETLPNIIGHDWVIHIGAISSTAERDIDKILRQNYDFTRWIFDSCKDHGVNLQYASSAGVYGHGSDFQETAPPDPQTPYAWSKYLCERYHKENQGKNIVQGFRYFNVYGPEGEEHKGEQASPYYRFKQQAATQGRIEIFRGSENFKRDFIQVNTLIDLQLRFLDIQESGVWNIGTGCSITFRDVAEKFNCPIVEVDMPNYIRPGYQTYTCADMTKTRRTLGIDD